ncbi:MAG: hypothetical protein ACR2JJ_03930 [Sphingomicrobium sp.]
MSHYLFIVPLALLAAPVAAQPAPEPGQIQIPSELTDPAMADRLANTLQALSKAFLELPVGEVQAAVEGREPTSAEKGLTIRELGRRDDPHFDRNLEQQIAQSKPMIEHGMKAFAQALPAMTRALSEAARQMERATANMPRPDYPRR